MNKLNELVIGGATLIASLNGSQLRRVSVTGPRLNVVVEDSCLDLALLRADGATKVAPQPFEGLDVASGFADQLLLWGYSIRAERYKRAGFVEVTFHHEGAYRGRHDFGAGLPEKFRANGPNLHAAFAAAFGIVAAEYQDAAYAAARLLAE